MRSVFYVILAILIFAFLIFVHELGHFVAAKLLGVQVNEFAMGMGPAIWKRKKGETLYSLRALPIGGFCAMEGEDEACENPRAFTSKSPWRRFVILVAGAGMNYLVGILVLVVVYSVLHLGFAQPIRQPVLDSFLEGCALEEEGILQVGDEILKIDGHRILMYEDVGTYLAKNTTGKFDLVLRRDGKTVRLDDVPMQKQTFEIDGKSYELFGLTFRQKQPNFGEILVYSWKSGLYFVRLVWNSLGDLISGIYSIRDMSGPVGIVSVIEQTGTAAESTAGGLVNVFYLCAFIAVNLAVMNMLPIPALDGGRLFMLVITAIVEKITRKKINPKFEGYIHAAGMALLLAFMAFVTCQDIMKLFVR